VHCPPTATLLLLLCCASCDGSGGTAVATGGSALDGRPARSRDPRVVSAREALEAGRLDVAGPLVARLGPGLGVERALLRARTAHLSGDRIGALAELEAARRTYPGDGRVPATKAELYAVEGYLDEAANEIRRGLVVDPECPDLRRAQAVLFLSRPGEARKGLAHLEEALAADPGLPFARRALVQALVLVSRADLAEGDPAIALGRAERAHAIEPADPEVRETLAEALAADMRFDEALALYAELLGEGRIRVETVALLEKRAATFCQLEGDREGALTHYVRARELGLPDDALGHGAAVLRQEAADRVELGRALLDAGELPGARAQLESALRYDPGSFDAHNQLAVLAFRERDFEAAVETWTELLEQSLAAGGHPLEPVHLNLAKALRNLERRAEALEVLRAYLDAEPGGTWAAETDDLIWALERELGARDSGGGR
jgi:tetratricopeptide (TPR) repeat protein